MRSILYHNHSHWRTSRPSASNPVCIHIPLRTVRCRTLVVVGHISMGMRFHSHSTADSHHKRYSFLYEYASRVWLRIDRPFWCLTRSSKNRWYYLYRTTIFFTDTFSVLQPKARFAFAAPHTLPGACFWWRLTTFQWACGSTFVPPLILTTPLSAWLTSGRIASGHKHHDKQ